MKRIALGLLAAGLPLAVMGCAPNSFVGSSWVQSRQCFGDVGIVGHNSVLTVEKGSKVPTVSIQGNGNTVTVEDGAWVNKLEFWGSGNTVSLPNELLVRGTQVGANTIIRRARAPSTPLYTPVEQPGAMPVPEVGVPPPGRGGAATPPPHTVPQEPLPPVEPEGRRP